MTDEETHFDKFWTASSLDRFNVQQFSRQLNSYDSDNKDLLLEYPDSPDLLPQPKSQINRISKSRVSTRVFADKELSVKELGRLLSSFHAANGLEHRAYPSAGATYATEVFCVAFNVERYSGKILYYDPEKHGVVTVSDDAPSWETASASLNMNITGVPNLLIILASFPQRAAAKYGERGGRFVLLEAGAAVQQLSMQIAESSKLKGVAVGGMLDSTWKSILKLDHTDAQITIGYLAGY